MKLSPWVKKADPYVLYKVSQGIAWAWLRSKTASKCQKPPGKVATLDNPHQLFLASIAALNQGISSTVSPTPLYRYKLKLKVGHCLEGQGQTAKQQSAA